MTLSVPPAVNYQSPLIAVPTRWDQAPIEGSKIIPCEVDWGTMGGTNHCVSFNLQNNATLNFSQIVALSIDNSLCGSDIEFIFPDTTETLFIPAYAPKTIVPVFTNQTQFWLSCSNAQSEDITRFSILNSMPPPVAIPTTQEQNAALQSDVTTASSGSPSSTQIIPIGVNGTIENIFITYNIYANATGGSVSWALVDGNGKTVCKGYNFGNLNNWASGISFSLSDMRIRFQNGLSFNWSSQSVAAGASDINVFYRTP